ncbi:hypothetical protein [Actinomadura kijaniata]|uniref:hypothetical protein n=1 Tax=Actinomadura kijaniata TaxID=46161 RepID=UPI00083707F4|nr:hypothetical protein [Actinomadura kijaniata]
MIGRHEAPKVTALPPVTQLPGDQICAELRDLRATEPQLPADPAIAPEGDALEHAVRLLTIAAEGFDPVLAADSVQVEHGTLPGGNAGDIWLETLTAHPDPDQVWKTRRGARLLATYGRAQDGELFTDADGRLVVLLPSPTGGRDFLAEWPTGLPDGWNEHTVIAGDHGQGNTCGPPLALTRTPAGWRAQLLPIPPHMPPITGFTWGYDGTGPAYLYDALMRAALDEPQWVDYRAPEGSRLATALTTTPTPLQLAWPTIVEWARQDVARIQTKD